MERQVIAREIARYFYLHLQDELKKQPRYIDEVKFDGRTPRQIDEQLTRRLCDEFPGLECERPAPYNFIEKWSGLNQAGVKYSTFSFEAYNITFLERILRLKNWNQPQAEKEYKDRIFDVFAKYDYHSRKWSPATFLKFENNMREILREIVHSVEEIDFEKGWAILFAESNAYQLVVSEFFEKLLHEAYDEAEGLLENILPVKIAQQLKKTGHTEPVYIESATVLFADFVGFTRISSTMSPKALIERLDECFSLFDQIIDKYGLEKIKTIGDAYMCAGGVTNSTPEHAILSTRAALDMRDAILDMAVSQTTAVKWNVRIGLHTGALVAGVIGKKRFAYDIWGDTVNTASRMESASEPGRVNISRVTHDLIYRHFECEPRGEREVKGKGLVEMFFVNARKAD
jgi:class 3 adenylate cyclase